MSQKIKIRDYVETGLTVRNVYQVLSCASLSHAFVSRPLVIIPVACDFIRFDGFVCLAYWQRQNLTVAANTLVSPPSSSSSFDLVFLFSTVYRQLRSFCPRARDQSLPFPVALATLRERRNQKSTLSEFHVITGANGVQ